MPGDSDDETLRAAAAADRAQILARPDGATIAYHRTVGSTPGVIFMGGFRSDMTGTKATTIEAFCRDRGRAFVRFDYLGHGRSSGAFTDGTIGRWSQDAIAVLDALTEGPQVLVGSSMGGWIMLLAALARPARVAGLVGIAAAPDFTEVLMWQRYPPEVRAILQRDGVHYEPSEYDEEPNPITMKLIEDGREHLVLERPLAVHCPVWLMHGMEDDAVPWEHSLRIAEMLLSNHVTVTLIKDGEHRLSRDEDLVRMCRVIDALCEEVG